MNQEDAVRDLTNNIICTIDAMTKDLYKKTIDRKKNNAIITSALVNVLSIFANTAIDNNHPEQKMSLLNLIHSEAIDQIS